METNILGMIAIGIAIGLTIFIVILISGYNEQTNNPLVTLLVNESTIEDNNQTFELRPVYLIGTNPPINNAPTNEEIVELHWNHMPLKYSFENKEQCYPIRLDNTYEAIKIIEEKTNNKVSFEENNLNPDIIFNCSKSSKIDIDGSSTLGEATVYHYTDTNIISNAVIDLYGGTDVNCLGFPSVEIHEILHALNIGHITHHDSIMNPISYCNNKKLMPIDDSIFNNLKEVYR